MSHPPRLRLLLLIAAVGTLGLACKEPNPVFDPNLPPPGESCVRGIETTEPFNVAYNPDAIDVLFVIGNAPAAEPLQRRLSSAMPSFIAGLRGKGLDFHVGTVSGDTSNPNTAGSLLTGGNGVAGCAGAPRFVTSAMGEDAALFATCNVQIGNNGIAAQEHLEAAQIALTVRAGEPITEGGNQGFLRPEARLLVIFASDRDDCSNANLDLAGAPNSVTACEWKRDQLLPVGEALNSLLSLKDDPDRVAIGLLGGGESAARLTSPDVLSPVCKDAGNASIYPAYRLLDAVEFAAPWGYFESACSSSYAGGLGRMLDRIATPAPITLCPAARLAAPPIEVRAGQDTVLSTGTDGYVFLGRTDDCPNGAVSISPNALTSTTQRIEIDFCGL